MPDQIRIPEPFDFLFEPIGTYRNRASYGGRGSGKSHSFATALVVHARHQKLRILCCREIHDSIKTSVKQVLDNKIAECGFGDFFASTNTEIIGQNGSHFTFAGLRSNPDAIKSMEGIDVAWVDEASAISARSLEFLEPTIRKPSSEIWYTWNPDLPTDPVDDLFRGNSPDSLQLKEKGTWALPPRTILRQVHWDGNPWFGGVLEDLRQFHQRRDPDKYAHIWLGEYRRNSEARVFHNWTVKEFEAPETVRRFYLGADFGFSVDPTVLIRCYIDGRTLYVDHEAWAVKCEIDRTAALFDKIPGARKWPLIADSSNPQIISYLWRNGFANITGAAKGPGSIEDGVEFLKSYDIVVHPRCKHVIDELTLYSYEVDQHTGEVLPKLADKKNHTIDALRYAVENVRRSTFGNFAPPIVVTRPRGLPT